MTEAVLWRFVKSAAAVCAVLAVAWAVLGPVGGGASGDFETREGDILLSGGKFDAAVERFDAALDIRPDHRGALLGKAAALIGLDRLGDAETLLTHAVSVLSGAFDPAEATTDAIGRGALAAAYANRGIVRDRLGRYEEALRDYAAAIRIDNDIADGPGWIEWLLHHDRKPSSVAGRARYLYEQLQKPEAERVMRIPDLDAAQRMYKP